MENKRTVSKTIFFLGFLTLVSGITLVMIWWDNVVVIFKGVIGALLAVAGVIILASAKE